MTVPREGHEQVRARQQDRADEHGVKRQRGGISSTVRDDWREDALSPTPERRARDPSAARLGASAFARALIACRAASRGAPARPAAGHFSRPPANLPLCRTGMLLADGVHLDTSAMKTRMSRRDARRFAARQRNGDGRRSRRGSPVPAPVARGRLRVPSVDAPAALAADTVEHRISPCRSGACARIAVHRLRRRQRGAAGVAPARKKPRSMRCRWRGCLPRGSTITSATWSARSR